MDFVKKQGQWHKMGENGKTVCGQPMLGRNYANGISVLDRKPCGYCLANHWIVTRDLIDDGKMLGARSQLTPIGMTEDQLPVWFRVFDGDGNLYFEGKMAMADFEPLDELGRAYGATELKYRDPADGNVWRVL